MTRTNLILAAIAAALWTVTLMSLPSAAAVEAERFVPGERFQPARYCISRQATTDGVPMALPCRDVFEERYA